MYFQKTKKKKVLTINKKKIPIYWLINLWLGSLKTKYLMKYIYINYKKKYWAGYFLKILDTQVINIEFFGVITVG
jgi:hypothetical protein